MRLVFALLALGTAVMAEPTEAQTLNVRPAPFADLRPGTQARHGEVVLGQTTLTGALRIFAEHLRSDSVKVARAHVGTPLRGGPDPYMSLPTKRCARVTTSTSGLNDTGSTSMKTSV